MAKLQAVFKTEMYLTEVAHVADKARYFISDFIYDDPTVGYPVAITGFLNNTNNAQGEITAVNLTGSMWFEITYVAQVDETHEALARSSSTQEATCAQITKPLPYQNFTRSRNRNGCNYHQKNGAGKPKKGRPGLDDTLPEKGTGAFFNRRLTKGAAAYWKHTLSGATRAAWKAAAVGNTWLAYDGTTVSPKGFHLWMAVQRFSRYWAFSPGVPGFNLFKPAETLHGYTYEFPALTIPAPFQAYPAPNVTSAEVFDGYDLFIHLSNDPDPYNCDLLTVRAKNWNPTPPSKPTKYVDINHFYNPDGSGGTADIYFDYPGLQAQPQRNVRVGIRWFNYVTNQISPPTWILASS